MSIEPDKVEPPTFEQVRDACAELARATVFAQMTLRKKIDAETAVAVSTEIYMELKSMRAEAVKR